MLKVKAKSTKLLFAADNGYTVMSYKATEGYNFHAVGTCLPQAPVKVELTGEWVESPKYGKQFAVSEFKVLRPDTRDEFVSYVSSLGVGIGPVKSRKLFELCGSGVWEMIEEDRLPAKAKKIAGAENLDKLRQKLHEDSGTLELIRLLDGIVPVDVGDLQKAGIGAEEVRRDPYILCLHNAPFDNVDAFALSKGLAEPTSVSRIKAGLHAVLRAADTRGCTCITKEALLHGDRCRGLDGVLQRLNGKNSAFVTEEMATDILFTSISAGDIVLNSGYFYTRHMYDIERFVAKTLIRLHEKKPRTYKDGELDYALRRFEECEHIQLSDEQRKAVEGVMNNRVNIVTGYPGTGKTTLIKAVLYLLETLHDGDGAILLSPTGRAARRMEEATSHPASTVLSALGYTGSNVREILDDDTPLPGDTVIVDEVSMMDLQQTAMLLKHIKPDSRVIFIGDPDQLPSVGSGNVLHDMISSGAIPVFPLSQIFRQKSEKWENPIPANAAKIRAGDTNLIWAANEESAFMQAVRVSDDDAFNTAKAMYLKIVNNPTNGIGLDEVALLVPYRKKSGVTKLTSWQFNMELQAELNPPRGGDMTISSHGITFRPRDKVMQLKNTEAAKNGDVGYIRSIINISRNTEGGPMTEKIAFIEFNGVEVEYTAKDFENVDLAYASSVHKMQGSEADTVILVVSDVHSALLVRNVVYTAITRAAKHVIVVGNMDALNRAICHDSTKDVSRSRITLLASRLHALKSK